MKVTVYSKPLCGGCNHVKEFLTNNGIEFEERDVSVDKAAHKEVTDQGVMTLPLIKIETDQHITYVVGYDPNSLAEHLN